MLFSKPLLGEPAAPFELVQQRSKRGGIGIRPVQLVPQIQPRVLAARQQPQRSGTQAGLGRRAGRSL
jgi:hypothetical protein